MSWLSRLLRTKRDYNDEFRKAQETDLPRRLAVLTPEIAAGWIEVIEQALPLVALETPKSTCDYGPWRRALNQLRAPVQSDETFILRFADADSGLINFSTDASKPGWPDDHAHLVEFALRYLEADVMLFRSGYTKRHLLRRLRAAKLDAKQTKRAVALVQRAVTGGTGLEEFREIKRLAVRVGDEELKEWLRENAKGAFVNADHYLAAGYYEVFRPLFDAGRGEPKGCFLSPDDPRKLDVFSLDVVKTSLPNDDPRKRNAWCVLHHMILNERHSPHGLRLD